MGFEIMVQLLQVLFQRVRFSREVEDGDQRAFMVREVIGGRKWACEVADLGLDFGKFELRRGKPLCHDPCHYPKQWARKVCDVWTTEKVKHTCWMRRAGAGAVSVHLRCFSCKRRTNRTAGRRPSCYGVEQGRTHDLIIAQYPTHQMDSQCVRLEVLEITCQWL